MGSSLWTARPKRSSPRSQGNQWNISSFFNDQIVQPKEIEGDQLQESKPFNAPTKLNPYYLPWIMSEIFHDVNVLGNAELKKDLADLVDMFKEWTPSTKMLKDLKYILEPMKSKL